MRGRYVGTISSAALKCLVDAKPFPYLLLDLRQGHSLHSPNMLTRALPDEYGASFHIPAEELESFFSSGTKNRREQNSAYPLPTRDTCIVLIDDHGEASSDAAMTLAQFGYHKCLVVEGGASSLPGAPRAESAVKLLSRDATAALLGVGGSAAKDIGAVVLDLRRHDERALYGYIQGTRHIPVEQLPAALAMTPSQWMGAYRFPKPERDDVIVLHCRAGRRALWAAEVCAEKGYSSCFVYRAGTHGWRLDPSIKSYAGYSLGEPPPDPEPFAVESVDLMAAVDELRQLELLPA